MFSSELWNKSGVSTYSIDQSIRFNDDDSAYMYKDFSGAGNQKQFTISLWLKRSLLGSRQDIWSYQQDVPLIFFSDDTIRVFLFGGTSLVTNRVFRDPSAWCHFVLTVDSTNAVSSERIRLYVNGQRETSFSTESYPSLNADASVWTSGLQLRLFRLYGGTNYYDGYAAEIHYLDGISYGPEFFGETNDSGIWIPKEYSGSYGSNGFKIDGRDSADLGDDESGNGNDFTTSGLAAHDQMVGESPTNNHCTWNVLRPTGSTTMSDGNLTVTTSGATYKSILGTIGIPPNSGIFYYEGVVHSHTIQLIFGWGSSEMGVNQNNNPATPKWFGYGDYLGKYYSSSGDGSVGDAFENNDVIGVWIDTDNTSNNLKFYRNGTLQSTHSFDFSDVDFIMPLTQHLNGCSATGRFASNQWTQTPSGITDANAINTKNLGS
tara:strand:- start:967 stop:2262 length:1296 start_codon:yes stop_codon:yes gene_type:complete